MKYLIRATIIFSLLLGAYAQADTIELVPGGESWSGLDCSDADYESGACGPGNDAILDWLDANVDDFDSDDSLYKSDEDGDAYGDDGGAFADYYRTEYSNPVGDPGDALIEWLNVGGLIADATWLLVKDGKHSPIWYLFDISGWDGMMDISLTGFWPNGGAISHVEIFGGGNGTSVPEPGTLGLLGLGLLAMAARRRRVGD